MPPLPRSTAVWIIAGILLGACAIAPATAWADIKKLTGGKNETNAQTESNAQQEKSSNEGKPSIVGVDVGFGNHYKVGLWTPVTVRLRGGLQAVAGKVSIETADGDGAPFVVTTPDNQPLQLLPGEEQSIQLFVRFGNVDNAMKVLFQYDGDAVDAVFSSSNDSSKLAYRTALELQPLIVTIGLPASAIDEAAQLTTPKNDDVRPVAAQIDDLGALPIRWYGYDGAQSVIVATAGVKNLSKIASDDARFEALEQWVRMGGQLVFCVGANAGDFLADSSPWNRFSPGRVDKIVTFRQSNALETYCESGKGLATSSGASFHAPKLIDVHGITEAQEADLPLVVRRQYGLGQVVFFAGDPDEMPLKQWPDRKLLFAKLLSFNIARGVSAEDDAVSSSAIRYEDMTGQLRSTLDQFEGVRVVPFSVVAGLIILYILLIGPGDFFLLKRVIKRMEWTWITFPLIVAGVSLAAYFLAHCLKGDQLRVNQVDVVDVDAASGFVRGTSWWNIFSPRMEHFTLSVEPYGDKNTTIEHRESYATWLGLPGHALGGMRSRSASESMWRTSYTYSPDLNRMCDVPIQVWATKSFTGRWSAKLADDESVVESELKDDGQVIEGIITPYYKGTIKDAVLFHHKWVYLLGDVSANVPIRVGSHLKRVDANTWLTGTRMEKQEGKDQYRQVGFSYDFESRDVAYIMQRMLFYNAATGYGLNRPWNGYQGFVDMSNLLKTGGAVLFGRASGSSEEASLRADVHRNAEKMTGPADTHSVFYRIVLPVEKK